MKRRSFIRTTGTAVTLPMLLNGMKVSALPRTSIFNFINDETDRVLVLIQLSGGNDGLNMVIQLDQYDNLANVRGNILVPQSSVLGLTDAVGLHPSMTGIRSMYDNDRLTIVQSAGYPDQNRSHFRSTDIWTSGSPANQNWTTGWLGRYLDGLYPGFPSDYPNDTYPDPFAITMGSLVSETCQGVAANFSLTLNDPFTLGQLVEGEPGSVPNTPYGDELTFLRTTIAQTNAYSEVVTTAANNGSNMVTYPDGNRLAQQLKNVALLVAGGLQTKVYVVNLGGFDTHANQVQEGDLTTGEHADLLATLSEAMAVFQEDLSLLGIEERVISMTFSEFGRRIRSNDSLGTDHGTAAPLMVFGSCVNSQILGETPEISTSVDNDEGVAMQHDFRDVYGSILMDWFEVNETDVRSILYENFQYLPILRVCAAPTSTHPEADLNKETIETNAFPNPFKNWTTISFRSGNEWGRLSVFDAAGNEVRVLSNQRFSAGEHQIRFEAHDLPAGSYYYRLQLDGRQKTKKLIKI